uniref:Putative retroelement pol polyprotein, related n=1 Tax=Asparagus officinalis TaxID=4686 RepID=Q2AA05_ASPOF|nr:Putative retroelement pol polyprotein, related [Asparagus officinalis]
MNHLDASYWMLDSGATYHVTPRRDWFSSFERLDGGVIIMENDQSCGICTIGTVRIRMHDGVVRELKDVRFVPQLKKNLISVGALEAKGFKVTFEDAEAKVTKGSLVVMKGVCSLELILSEGEHRDWPGCLNYFRGGHEQALALQIRVHRRVVTAGAVQEGTIEGSQEW